MLGYLQEYRSNYNPENIYYQSIPNYSQYPQSAYAQADYKVNKALKLIAGTQWNKSAEGHSGFVSRYGAIFKPHKKWGVKILRGEAFRAPVTLESTLYDPPFLVGNDNLEPEIVTTYDAQLFYQDDKTYAAVTYFNSIIDKLIIYDVSVSPMSYTNGGKHRFDGIEFEAKRYINNNWHIIGSFMYQENNAEAGLNPTVVPSTMAKVGTGYTWNGGSASIFYTFFGTPPEITSALNVNPEPKAVNLLSANVRLDAHKLTGMKKGRSILTLRAENILNEKVFAPTFAYTGSPNSLPYNSGFMFFAGLAVNF